MGFDSKSPLCMFTLRYTGSSQIVLTTPWAAAYIQLPVLTVTYEKKRPRTRLI